MEVNRFPQRKEDGLSKYREKVMNMEKTSMEKIVAIKEQLKKTFGFAGKTVEQIRRAEAAKAVSLPGLTGITTEKTTIAGLAAEWVRPDQSPSVGKYEDDKRMILYFHGGGFISGSCDSHRDLVSRIAKASGVRVLVIEYRLAPEYKYPAANDDCLAAYRLLITGGIPAKSIVIGGDSTGGYLTLTTLLALRDGGDPLPAAAFFLSPHTDFLNYDGESYISRAESDPTGSLSNSRMCADNYFDASRISPPVLSPLHQELDGLPPLFIQVGDDEVILSDSVRLAERAKEAGVDVTLEIWENMWHIFRFMAYMLPEGEEALRNVGEFVRKGLG